MTTIAQVEVGQRFRLQRKPQTEYIKIDGVTGNAQDPETGNTRLLGQNTKVVLPPYDNQPAPRPRHNVWIDGADLTVNVSPFMTMHFGDLAKEYGNPSSVARTALGAWRIKLRPVMPPTPEESDMQALCEFTGLRPQEVIELAVYDLWRGWKGL